jgi:hypothetical protein
VGELIALQFPLRGDADADWTVGVVRWLSISEDDDFQAGAQILAEDGTPVMVYSETITDTITRIPRPAVAIPRVGPELGNTLIAPRGMFARGNVIRVDARDGTWLVEAEELSESTATFDRFSYRVVESD